MIASLRWRYLGLAVLILIATPLVILLGMAVVPFAPLRYQASVAPTYAEALEGIRSIIAAEPANIRPDAHPILLDHGAPTERVFVLLHGLSNCPIQFSQLGEMLFAKGFNVFIPRMPYHGDRDTMNAEWGALTAQDMLDESNRAVDLARGLGKSVTVVGLSVNGTTAAWMAQNRVDVDQAVLLAPFLAPKGTPLWAMKFFSRILARLPNRFLWWDPILKQDLPRPDYCYPRFPTRVIGQVTRMGEDVLTESGGEAARCGKVVVMTSASDQAVNNDATEKLIRQWRSFRPELVTTFVFPKEQEVPHDFIDPNQHNQKVAIAYPKLMELLIGPER